MYSLCSNQLMHYGLPHPQVISPVTVHIPPITLYSRHLRRLRWDRCQPQPQCPPYRSSPPHDHCHDQSQWYRLVPPPATPLEVKLLHAVRGHLCLQWGFYKSWSTCPPTRPDLTGRNCPLSAMGVKVSLVCSNSTVFSPHRYISQYGEVNNSINPRDAYMHHWPGSPLTQVMTWYLLGARPLPEPIFIL